ncbi:MAG: T9SS type A sorting domain-containing protein [Bacteroidia bacterium]|nr:T9SS type A sorting domain-containing protein [Bacteroidia bacterium]
MAGFLIALFLLSIAAHGQGYYQPSNFENGDVISLEFSMVAGNHGSLVQYAHSYAEDGFSIEEEGEFLMELSAVEPHVLSEFNLSYHIDHQQKNIVVSLSRHDGGDVITEDCTLRLTGIGIVIDEVISRKRGSGHSSIDIYPNPCRDLLIVQGNFDPSDSWEFYDRMGKLMASQKCINKVSILKIDVSSYAEGIYYLNILSGGKVVRNKIVIR